MYGGFTHEGVTLQGDDYLYDGELTVNMEGLTFTNTLSKKFKSIVIPTEYGADIKGDGWSDGTWTGDAESVTMDANSNASGITSITFLLGD